MFTAWREPELKFAKRVVYRKVCFDVVDVYVLLILLQGSAKTDKREGTKKMFKNIKYKISADSPSMTFVLYLLFGDGYSTTLCTSSSNTNSTRY